MEQRVQFSIFLVNKPGVLSPIFRELAKAKINVIGIAMMDAMEHGVLRMIVDKPEDARPIFRRLNAHFAEAKVLQITLGNRPGAVADICERLANAHIRVAYMYCTTGAKGGKALVFLHVPDLKKAQKILDGSRPTRRDMKVKLRRPPVRNRR